MKTLIFDTETTALIQNRLVAEANQPRIIEFCGGLYDSEAQLIRELDFLCDPGVPITEEITKITGIKPEDVAGKKRFASHAADVRELIAEADVVVAHNLTYDMAVVNFELGRLQTAVEWPVDLVCTVEGTEHLLGYRLNLSALHQFLFDEPFSGAHRAKVDVTALARCYFELVRRGEL